MNLPEYVGELKFRGYPPVRVSRCVIIADEFMLLDLEEDRTEKTEVCTVRFLGLVQEHVSGNFWTSPQVALSAESGINQYGGATFVSIFISLFEMHPNRLKIGGAWIESGVDEVNGGIGEGWRFSAVLKPKKLLPSGW